MATITYTITLVDPANVSAVDMANVTPRTRGFDLGTMFIAPYITYLAAGGGGGGGGSSTPSYYWS